ncbi:MAG: hypothetical protein GXO79_11835 [Chlorobi bacterium]|nr:hypothetical protein [Chlorobiota bacterium]
MRNLLLGCFLILSVFNSCSVNKNKEPFNVRKFNIDSLAIEKLIYSDNNERKISSFLRNSDKDSIPFLNIMIAYIFIFILFY